jgi:hypothetical protein
MEENSVSIFSKPIGTMSDAALQHEAEHLEEVQNEITRRAQVAATAEEDAAREAARARDAAKTATLKELLVSTEREIEEATARLEVAALGLQAFVVRDGLLGRHRAILDELHTLGSPAPAPNFRGLSEEAIKTVERVFTPLGCDLGITVTARPMLVYK